jgi:hypothetical protein
MRLRPACVLALACAAAFGGCSSDDPDPPAPKPEAGAPAPRVRAAPLARAHCPPDLANCKTARGRIIYVERVDPDGDGDAHFVLISRQSITLPGISVIDVAKSLRPHPLPGPGDRISAAGPVYRGSYGQRQIQALEVHVARRPRPARAAS